MSGPYVGGGVDVLYGGGHQESPPPVGIGREVVMQLLPMAVCYLRQISERGFVEEGAFLSQRRHPYPENIFDIIIEKEKLRDKVCRKGIIGTMRAHAKQKEQRCKQR